MTEVDPLFVGSEFKTHFWISEVAQKAFLKYQRKENPRGRFIAKLRYYATAGLASFEGAGKTPVRHEWDGVYRVSDGGLFRLIGFYESDAKTDFIVIDAFEKRGRELSSPERGRIDGAAKVKRDGTWKRRSDDGGDNDAQEGDKEGRTAEGSGEDGSDPDAAGGAGAVRPQPGEPGV